MEVLCFSMPRTGTMTIQHALQELGYQNVFHFDAETLRDFPLRHIALCNDLAIKKFQHGLPITKDKLDDVFGKYDAASDVPICYFWEDMLAAYPDAKVIIVERDVDRWYNSFFVELFPPLFETWTGWLLYNFAEPVLGVKDVTLLVNLNMGYFQAKTWPEMQRNARKVYRQHYFNIRKACHEQNRPLLDMKLEDGWPKLCEFLGKPVRSGELPRTNETKVIKADTERHMRVQIRSACLVVMKWMVVPAAALAVGLRWRWNGGLYP